MACVTQSVLELQLAIGHFPTNSIWSAYIFNGTAINNLQGIKGATYALVEVA